MPISARGSRLALPTGMVLMTIIVLGTCKVHHYIISTVKAIVKTLCRTIKRLMDSTAAIFALFLSRPIGADQPQESMGSSSLALLALRPSVALRSFRSPAARLDEQVVMPTGLQIARHQRGLLVPGVAQVDDLAGQAAVRRVRVLPAPADVMHAYRGPQAGSQRRDLLLPTPLATANPADPHAPAAQQQQKQHTQQTNKQQ
eukprot:SAG22_NODE_2191_length_2860_cov_22.131112_4_plen_201_part_00